MESLKDRLPHCLHWALQVPTDVASDPYNRTGIPVDDDINTRRHIQSKSIHNYSTKNWTTMQITVIR